MIKILLLSTNQLIISQIEEVGAEIGDPNCRLIKPHDIDGDNMTPWMNEFTTQDTMMINSDKILTLVDPNEKYLTMYQEILK